MRTFLDIQNDTLQRTGDDSDQDKMRDLVKDSINSVHRKILTERRYSFMIWPKVETLNIVADQKFYSLHPQFGQMWYGQNESTGDWLEEIPAGGLVEMGDNIVTGESDNPYRYLLTALQNVKTQPTTAGAITVTTTGGTESASNNVVVKGIDNNGDYIEETLSSGSAWTTLTSSASFSIVESISKVGTFTRTITMTIGSTTVLALLPSEYGRQYRQLELTKIPTQNIEFLYRFYRKPLMLESDYDIPMIPEEYADILVYGSLLDMQGFSRPDPGELKEWQKKFDSLIDQMQKQYQQSRSLNGRASYIRWVPR